MATTLLSLPRIRRCHPQALVVAPPDPAQVVVAADVLDWEPEKFNPLRLLGLTTCVVLTSLDLTRCIKITDVGLREIPKLKPVGLEGCTAVSV
jgi:hypothetical protein